ncbi:hypothetical protein ACFWYW_02600 [Nonomuraea sp. NPDC059023]|uniref:hypothetical protein n=1 Tax=unclassified Nonomuraea TaxID=2593643 RepID=UPI00368E1905
MSRRYRLSLLALLVAGGYVIALAIVGALALISGDLSAMLRLTLVPELDESLAVTGRGVLIVGLVGAMWAWALWQSLRGPLVGPPYQMDRDTTRLRIALYVAAASWLVYPLVTSWSWWMSLLDAAVMLAVVWLYHPVLTRGLKYGDHMRSFGIVAYGSVAVSEVLDLLGMPVGDFLITIGGLAGLLWTMLLLRAQRNDRRWQTSTVVYGIAALVLMLTSSLLDRLLEGVGNVPGTVTALAGALSLIWLTRSAHDLADPRHAAVTADRSNGSGLRMMGET